MIRSIATSFLVTFGMPVHAETVILERTIRAHAIISIDDVKIIRETIPGMISDPKLVAGLEARSVLYAGRPIRKGDVGPPAIIERNQLVGLVFTSGGLLIATEGRSLGRASVGERIKVLNLSSRTTVSGIVNENGKVVVGQ